jgi:uncharacterized 2Fe-2S/4Fe-4S cluster protein (DUF4445 family)
MVHIVGGSVEDPHTEELQFLSEGEIAQGYRLACRTAVHGDLRVFVADQGVLRGPASRKGFVPGTFTINPAVKTYPLKVPAGEGILAALEQQHGLRGLSVDRSVATEPFSTDGEGGEALVATVWMDREVIRVGRAGGEAPLGLAVDVGTTTVALYLCDLTTGGILSTASFTNPQVIFGDDVISRIAYSRNHPEEGVRRMQSELISAINRTLRDLTQGHGRSPEDIVDVTVVGNTVMHHIFLGIAPDSLGVWPFAPSLLTSKDVKARDVGIGVLPSAYVHVLPVEAGFVGADNVGVLISEEPYNQEKVTLTVDMGTNGEVVLGNKERMLSCSCATGPALEGSHMTCGMRAVRGAIGKVRIDPVTRDVDYKVVGSRTWRGARPGRLKAAGICGSGAIDAVAQLYGAGLLNKSGAFVKDGGTTRLRRGEGGRMEFVLAWPDETSTGKAVVITQKDVRQVQLAKGALYAGCSMLMKRLGIDRVDLIALAGAFGMHIDKQSAVTIGLLPVKSARTITSVGNAAGRGAFLALLDRDKRDEADRIARWVEHVELATEDGFQEEFLKALNFP